MSAISVSTRPDGVAVLTFDQPDSRANVLTGALWEEFGAALAALAARTELSGLVLASAKPGVFIAGADLKLLAAAPAPNDPGVRAFIDQGLRVLEQLEALPFPTCAAIDGAALGGGLEVALACDHRVCGSGPKVQLGLPEVKLGLIPGWGGTQRLPRVVGLTRAAELLASGEGVGAADAADAGLAATAPNPLEAAVAQLLGAGRPDRARRAGPLAATGFVAPTVFTRAAAEAVRVLVEGARLPLADAIRVETDAFMRLAGSDESKRLIAAFFASRKK